jgi:hypothetical protein
MRRPLWPLGLVLLGAALVGRRHDAPPVRQVSSWSGPECDPSYPTLCLPLDGPDLDCADVPAKNFPVRGPDRHGFDADHDGLGCEPWPRASRR